MVQGHEFNRSIWKVSVGDLLPLDRLPNYGLGFFRRPY